MEMFIFPSEKKKEREKKGHMDIINHFINQLL